MTRALYNVRVTPKHISGATPQEMTKCAIAQAIVESEDDIVHARVNRHFINITRASNDTIESYRTPKAAADFIDAYDATLVPDAIVELPKPFTLRIEGSHWVGDRPRQMRQTEKARETAARRALAKATGRRLADVKPEEVESFDDEGFATTAHAPKSVIRQPKPRARVDRPEGHKYQRKIYNKRESVFENGAHESTF